MKNYYTLTFILILLVSLSSRNIAQTYSGPDSGGVSSGVIQSTDSFLKTSVISEPREMIIGNEETDGYRTPDLIMNLGQAPEGSNYIKGIDQNNFEKLGSSSTLLRSFSGIGMTNSIPPDPHMAVGPGYVITAVNTQFAIFDKDGNKIKSIDGVSWVTPAVPNPGVVTDPKVIYDHFNNRFVLVWLTINTSTAKTYWTVSVSHDSTPLGTWYTWALPSNLNGTADAKNYGDYEGLGFDKDCIYITGNMFPIAGGSFNYSKLRIIPKAQLYTNTAGAVSWKDIWNITVPFSSSSTFGIRPSIVFGTPNEYYLIYSSNGSGNLFAVYKLTNALTTPVLTGVNVPVTFYSKAPDVNQLGGSGNLLIDGGSSQIRNEPVFRDGYLWAVHSVRNPNPVFAVYSSVHYVKIDIAAGTAVEDFVFGDPGYWHNYPAIMVDKDKNMAITYSQSDTNSYIGAYYTSRLVTDPVGLQTSKPLQTGKGRYVVDFGSGRNRWGDYMGIALDPSDNSNIWMFTEYAAATNKWGTWVGEVRLTPTAHLYTDESSINFGYVQISLSSDTIPVVLRNSGSVNLSISNIPQKVGPFTLTDNFTFPKTIGSNDSLTIHLVFTPSQVGTAQQNLNIISNDNNYAGLPLFGTGYKINNAIDNTLYASSGSNDSGKILTIDPQSGNGTILGPSLFSEVRSISINPKTKVIYGITPNINNSTDILRVNALGGDSYTDFTLPLFDMGAIAFDSVGNLYAGMHSGVIYKINLQTREYTQLCSLKVKIQSLAFDPNTNELWGSPLIVLGSTKDRLFKINLATGDTTIVGQTGFAIQTNALAFDNSGNLFGVTGSSSQINNLISIDKNTAIGTQIGSIGYKNITGISFAPVITGISEKKSIPVTFNLMQNYPNPFNPSTTIEYSIPNASNVKITIYNILGDVVNVIFNSFREAGSYKSVWNADDRNGNKVSSGVYFYELKAVTGSGQESIQMKKMILLK